MTGRDRAPECETPGLETRRGPGPRSATRAVLRRIRAAALLALPIVAAGCISVAVGGRDDAALPAETFHVLEVPAPSAPAGAPEPGTGKVVAVRPFRAADRFARHVVRRDGPGRITSLDRDYWADEPSRAVTDVVREVVGTIPGVRAVVDPADAQAADLVVDGRIDEFAWVGGTPARALVRIRFTTSDPVSGRVLATSVREASEGLPGDGTEGLGVAMGRAVARVTREALGEPPAAGR